PGRGARVELYLPAAAGRIVSDPPATGDAQREVARTGRILMVEDQQDVREVTAALLKAAGYEVVAVPDASAAMACIERDDIDLLLSDVMLGSGRNGVELALAATAMKPGLRVLLVSGFDDTGAVARGGALPFELLRKPYAREQL